jgi:hypothetical protein
MNCQWKTKEWNNVTRLFFILQQFRKNVKRVFGGESIKKYGERKAPIDIDFTQQPDTEREFSTCPAP